MTEEQALVQQARQGDEGAFAALVEQNQGRIYHLALRMTGNPDDAAELCQEAFLNAWKGLGKFQGESSFSTWLYRIAYNVFYDYIRSRKETTELDSREVDATNSVEQENVGQRMDIYQSLEKLKEVERTCITLFYMEDVSIDKIAGIVGIPAGTVKSHLSRGKEKLAMYLKQNGYDGNR